jgi:hypothetical protein
MEDIAEICPIKRHILLKKYYLKRKLEKIMMDDESKRYPAFLELFTDYYQFKEESDKKIIDTVDSMTMKAHELNNWIIEKAQIKKKLKTGGYSSINNE